MSPDMNIIMGKLTRLRCRNSEKHSVTLYDFTFPYDVALPNSAGVHVKMMISLEHHCLKNLKLIIRKLHPIASSLFNLYSIAE